MARIGISASVSGDSAKIVRRFRLRAVVTVAGVLGLLVPIMEAPRALAQCDASLLGHYGGQASLVERSGSRIYAVFGDELFVYESPGGAAAPDELGSVLIPGDHLNDLAMSGSYAYVAARSSGLHVIDATDPNAPFVAATLDLPEDPWLIACANDLVFLCKPFVGNPDIFIVDVSTPSSPLLVGTYPAAAFTVVEIAADGNTLFLSTNNGVEFVDVSTPATPALLTTYYLGISFREMDVSNGVMAVVRGTTAHADILDVSNPAAPTNESIIIADSFSTVALNSTADRLYLGNYDVDIWDISTPSTPVLHADFSSSASDYAAGNTRIIVANPYTGIEQWNIADLDAPVSEWQVVKSPNFSYELAANNDRVLVVGLSELRVFDTSEPGGAVELPSIDFGVDDPEEVAITGDIACVVHDADLSIVDLAAPGGADEVGSESTLINATAVAASGDIALVGELGSIVEVFDISDPTNPIARGSIDLDTISPPNSGSVWKIAMQGSFAAVSTYGDTYIISFADPNSPQLEYEFNVVDPPVDVAVTPGMLCLVNDMYLRVDLYDLSSPPIPVFVGSYDETILTPSKIAVDGDLLAIFDDSLQYSEIIFVDISDPASPTAITRVSSNPYCDGLAFTGDRLWRLGGDNPANSYHHTGLWELTRPGFDAVPPPDDLSICDGGNAQFAISASGSPTYQWRKDGVDLSNGFTGNGSLIAGAFSDTLSILSAAPGDAGEYDCVLTNSCGASTTPPGTLAFCTGCDADLDCNCRIDLSDLATLLADYGCTGGGCAGDIDGDGATGLSDLAILLAVYDTTCN